MVSEKIVRAFFKISELDQSYFTVAQAMLMDFAEAAGEEDEIDAAELERFGNRYVDFMIAVYAARFTDEEMAQLMLQYQTPAFKKLTAIDTEAESVIETFLHGAIGDILGVTIKTKDEAETTQPRRLI